MKKKQEKNTSTGQAQHGSHQVSVFPDSQSLAAAAAEHIIRIGNEALDERGRFSLSLSGGSTPVALYDLLAQPGYRDRMPWNKTHLFWGDERHVPPGDPESNYRMVKETLLDQVEIPEENIFRVPAEMEVRLAAFAYEETLRAYFNDAKWPRFDLVLLGMGEDGHTASLFPNSPGLNEEHRWFIANQPAGTNSWRLTLSKGAINAARNILVLVEGQNKAGMLEQVLTGPYDPYQKPIQFISPAEGYMIWMVDENAASH